MGAGAPNRPLPPTPDEDANERTLIMKRVRPSFFFNLMNRFYPSINFVWRNENNKTIRPCLPSITSIPLTSSSSKELGQGHGDDHLNLTRVLVVLFRSKCKSSFYF